MWISTAKGLVKYDNFNWKIYNSLNSGLRTGTGIRCLAVDRELNKWIGIGYDLIKYSGDLIPGVDINTDNNLLNDNFYLYQNYPNPFNPNTIISFSIPTKDMVRLKVYDILGRQVAVLANRIFEAGQHEVKFNAGNLSSGVYFYRIESGSFIQTKKLLLMK
jgi:hypothetical protein